MSGVFDSQIALAQRQIEKYGEAITWTSAGTPIVSDVTKPFVTQNGEPTPHTVSFLFTSGKSAPFIQLLAGPDVEDGAAMGLLPAVDFTPTLRDTVTRRDGTKLAIKSINPLSPNGQILLYYVVFKR